MHGNANVSLLGTLAIKTFTFESLHNADSKNIFILQQKGRLCVICASNGLTSSE